MTYLRTKSISDNSHDKHYDYTRIIKYIAFHDVATIAVSIETVQTCTLFVHYNAIHCSNLSV